MASCVQLDKLKKSKSWFINFQYNPKKDQAGDVRNILLIVATLIAAVTFQAGVNPPGGVWQDNTKGHVAGKAIYASREVEFYVFLICNTVALSTSVLVIMSLTYKFPFHLEVFVATASMLGTYASAIFAVTPGDFFKYRYILIAAALPFVLRVLIYIVKSNAEEEQENLCCKCRRENSDDISCRRCGSEISKSAEDVKV
ncbi:uncharacterized protein LOC126723265 [Quercus robur]|uniref:uncharacterized protein LOC126723265 n=1 Tax=Quercus robur TaxID=38942 RepID=UPI002163CF5C|nr:uncharacterized protein LOC126723265 [Quercus robur]